MIKIVRSEDRGSADYGWLKAFYSFSFGNHFDPENVQFGPLRVMNYDTIQPGGGFPTHPHDNMEIITIILEGALEHQDSTGKKEVIRSGEVQRMTAGSGIMHSEFNHSNSDIVRLLQIWLFPNQKNLAPSYDQRKFDEKLKTNSLLKVVSSNKNNDTIFINQDAEIYLSDLYCEKGIQFDVRAGRGIYIYTIEGEIELNSHSLHTGDAAKIEDETQLKIKAKKDSKIILFDLKM